MRRAPLTLALPLALATCLPADPRDPPAELWVTAEPSAGTRDGFFTEDGWFVTFDQLAVVIGRVGVVEDDACTYYSVTQYSWLIDFTHAGREKVGLAYALGDCQLRFALPAPDDTTRVGTGGDLELLRRIDRSFNMVVEGQAEKGGVTKTFGWLLGSWFPMGPCLEAPDATAVSRLPLRSGERYEVRLHIRGEGFFESLVEPGRILGDFEAMDDNGDGNISPAEYDTFGGLGAFRTFDEGWLSRLGLIVTAEGNGCLQPFEL